MSHLRLVPPPAPEANVPAARNATSRTAAERRSAIDAYDDPTVVALSFFQAASGICLCRACSMKRHPAYGVQ